MTALDHRVHQLATEPNFATLTTLLDDGSPVASVMWIDADDESLLINTERHRLKFRNVRRDPRVQVLIIDRSDPGHYAAVRGVVEDHVFGEGAREHINKLSMRYEGQPFDLSNVVSERVILRIQPIRQRVRLSGVVGE
jgi:PPOX class probable F420-dependent enzyme